MASAVVMIGNRGNGGGSGAYIGNRLVLTCDHLFRGESGKRDVGRVSVTFADGQGSGGRVVRQDPIWDLAVIELTHEPRGIKPIRLAEKLPAVGERLHVGGFGSRGMVRFLAGRLKGFGAAKNGRRDAADTLIVGGASSRGGDSGGPILNDRGCLAGVLWGSNDSETVGSQIGRCRLFLRGLLRPNKSRQVIRKLPKVISGKTGPAGPKGETGPPGPQGNAGEPSETDRELRLAVQSNVSAIAALTRQMEIIAKGQVEQSAKNHETQIAVQDILILLQRNAKADEKQAERIDQLEKRTPVSYEIVAGRPKPGE